MKKITVHTLAQRKRAGEKIVSLTAYDATFARLLDNAGVDILLVGDSLGMVLQGHGTTLPVTLGDMIYHTACVRRGARLALVISDMPYMSYATPAQALGNAARLMAEGGAEVVKLEGGSWLAGTVQLLSQRGIPVCAHLGLLPQSIHRLGGYRVQGRDAAAAAEIREHALKLQEAGAIMLVLECVPSTLAADIARTLSIPVIGIGAGADCDGQVLVLHDMLGIGAGPRFARDFTAGPRGIAEAIGEYVRAVKAGEFPAPEHSYD